MKRFRKEVMRATVAAALSCSLAAPVAVNAVALYDTFKGARLDGVKGKRLDRKLWDSWDTQGALETRREISGGKAVLKSLTYGDPTTNEGARSGRSILPFPESAGALITEIEASVQTAAVEITGCEANTGVGEASGRVLSPRIGGFWFADSMDPPADDFTGHTWASIDVVRYASHDTAADPADRLKRNRLVVEAKVVHCSNATCSESSSPPDVKVLGIIKKGQKRRLRIKWVAESDLFEFQLHKNEPETISYDGAHNVGPPGRYAKRITHRGQPRNCALGEPPAPTERTRALGEVRIFDVSVRPALVP